MQWVETGLDAVLRFRRSSGWEVVSNFGKDPVPLPESEIVVASGTLRDELPGETTVWLRT